MGLLDKVDNLDDKEPAKKATPKKAVAKKATPKKAVAKKATPKAAVKSAKPKKVSVDQPKKLRPTGLPEGYELAGKMPRYIGWLINFAWNFGVLIGTLSVFIFGDPDLTIGFAGASLMILINWLVIPIWTGRNIGEFVSRTKYINSSGSKPLFLHAILNNSLGFLFLIGFILVGISFSDLSTTSGMTNIGIGAFFMITWVVNFFFKKNSDYSQGVFDLAFSAYLVKHVATGTETGWLAKFESLGDFGDKWQQKQEERQEKARKKAELKAAKAAESAAASEEESEDEDSDDSSDDEESED